MAFSGWSSHSVTVGTSRCDGPPERSRGRQARVGPTRGATHIAPGLRARTAQRAVPTGEASLNPLDTCEFPAAMRGIGGKCLIFATAGQHAAEQVKCFGLLTVMEIFRSEMRFAREHSGALLLEKLKAAGHYPYSDMDREPVA